MVSPYRGEAFEQRRHKRYKVCAAAKIEPLDDEDDRITPIEVVVADVGLTGMMLRADRPVPIGSSWRLCLYESQRLVTSVPIIVRYCTPEAAGRYRLGTQVMLEPFFLTWMGVPRRELAADELATEDRFAYSHAPNGRS